MPTHSAPSDEPMRVRRLTQEILPAQSDRWSISIPGTSTNVSLRVGADAMDDCAVFSMAGEFDLVIGSDYIRGPGFSLYEFGIINNYDIGYYLVGANLSDIAAMGARPIAFLSVVRYPKSLSDDDFDQLILGIRDACAEANVHDVGGDIGTAERIILSGTATGIAGAGKALRRMGARPGDILLLGGMTGRAGAALRYFRGRAAGDIEAMSPEDENALAMSWKRVTPQLDLGAYLSEYGVASSCQDTSDGLRAAVEQIAAASGVGFRIAQSSLRIDPIVQRFSRHAGVDPLGVVFGDSVDFRLLFTMPNNPKIVAQLTELFPDVFVIGEATESMELSLTTPDGAIAPLKGNTWRHQT